MEYKIQINSEEETFEFAARIAELMALQGVIFLKGTLGAGKTTFSRGLLRYYGHSGAVKSPTFTLVEPYDLEQGQVYHFDLYRLGDPEELEYLGVEDYLAGTSEQKVLCLIEWPEKGEGWLPECDLEITLSHSVTDKGFSKTDNLQAREIRVVGGTQKGEAVCHQLLSDDQGTS